MSPAAISAMLNAKPFEPFTIHTGDGSSVDVLSKEFTLLYPGGRTLRVVAPKFRGPLRKAISKSTRSTSSRSRR